jgi:hypothetical protein
VKRLKSYYGVAWDLRQMQGRGMICEKSMEWQLRDDEKRGDVDWTMGGRRACVRGAIRKEKKGWDWPRQKAVCLD